MTGKGQHIQQEAEPKTAEEFRAVADEHTQTLKDFWKRFMVSGLFVMAAIVIILACLAWFLNNSQVNAGGVNLSAAGARIALTETDEDASQVGYYERTESERAQLKFSTSNAMKVSVGSNLNNQNAGSIYPGASGVIKVTVTPLATDLNGATIDIFRILQTSNGNVVDERDASASSQMLALMKGHLLFFESCDNGFYSGRVVDSIGIPAEKFCETGSSKTTKPVNITLYWIWPKYLQNLVYTGNAGYYKNLFASENSDYISLQDYVNNNKNQFYYAAEGETPNAPNLSSSMSSLNLGQCADAYNKADDYLGGNIAYYQLYLSADETPKGANQ